MLPVLVFTEATIVVVITLQKNFEKKPCEDAEANVGMTEQLIGGQGKKDFMRFKKKATEGLVVSDTGIALPRGVTEESLKTTLDRFKGLAFKDFAARHQVIYLWQNLPSRDLILMSL